MGHKKNFEHDRCCDCHDCSHKEHERQEHRHCSCTEADTKKSDGDQCPTSHSKHSSGDGCCCCCNEQKEDGIQKDTIKLIFSSVILVFTLLIEHFINPVWWVGLIMYAAAYLICGHEVLDGALKSIAKRNVFGESFLMSIATLGAFAVGEYAEAVFVMIFFSLGELLEHIAANRTRNSVLGLYDLRPDTARLEINGRLKTVDPDDVKKDDIIMVESGERVPLDGIIISGTSSLNTSALTGESMPREAGVGDEVMSGCINIGSPIKIRVTSVYRDSTVARIIRLMEDSRENKSRQERFITRFSKIYTPVVVLLALIIALIPPIFFGNFSTWCYRALMCLVVSCPCAVAVSVPLTYFCGIGRAAKNGILIKGSAALESLSRVKTAVFDKTGTLTSGRFEVTRVLPVGISEAEFLRLTACAEQHSNHPIAVSLKSAYGGELGGTVTDITEYSGFGVSARVDGKTLIIGNAALMEKSGIRYDIPDFEGTVIYAAADGKYIGCAVISDRIKKDSQAAVSELQKMGIKTVMLTGDRRESAEPVAKAIGVDRYVAELLPDGKVAEIEKLIDSAQKNTVAFTGDGINDAPVLARADIGIAMGALGSDAAIEASDVVIADDRITGLGNAIKISRQTRNIAKQNIVFSLGFKIIVLILSALGISNMLLAAFADAGVLVIAVLNAARAFKDR